MNPGKEAALKEDIFSSPSKEILSYLRTVFARYTKDSLVIVMPNLKSKIGMDDGGGICKSHSNNTMEPNKKKKIFCSMPWVSLCIEPNVHFSPFCYCFKKKGYFSPDSNISLLHIWNSDVMHSYRKKMSQFDYEWCSEEDCLSRDSEDPFFKASD